MNHAARLPDSDPTHADAHLASHPATPAPVSVTGRNARPALLVDRTLALPEFADLCEGRAELVLSDAAARRLEVARERLQSCIDRNAVVYGITTGFGPLANREISAANVVTLQRNLIYHLATGVGALHPWAEARGVLLARLMSNLQGWSGASAAMIDSMIAVINSDLAPAIPEKGTVGASGDLTPCAHMALALMGEGEFITPSGQRLPAPLALARLGVAPHRLDHRDGLALVNGTSAMTAVAAMTSHNAARAIDWAVALTGLHAEVMRGHMEAWSPAFGQARPHPGQQEALSRLSARVAGSGWVDTVHSATRVADHSGSIVTHALPPQDPYTIRCAPQVIGAVIDVLSFHDRIVETELNAATDNPIFGEEAPYALHGGNFYGQHVAFASDALAPALVTLGVLAERQIARVTDEKLSLGLPAFLQPHQTGLQSGFMGAQVTASALLAELRTRLIPASVQSIPTNGNNQDVVSMGTIAARKTRDLFADLFRIFAIQALVLAQAAELRAAQLDQPISEAASRLVAQVRQVAPALVDDRPLSREIEQMALVIAAHAPA
jgi:tyrosine ammonia-lyase